MNPIGLGRQFRALRIKKELRQEDVGRSATLSRAVVSRIERGLIENVSVGGLARAAAALGATVDIRLRWNGVQLDRLLDEAHAKLVELVVLGLRASGWEVAVEVSFSEWGERGSIDVFAYHRLTGIVLVVEVKSLVPDSQATIYGLDRKARLAAKLAKDRGWDCRGVARLLVIGSSATSRCRIAQLESTYSTAFPCAVPRSGGGCATRSGRYRACCFSHTLLQGALAPQRLADNASVAAAQARIEPGPRSKLPTRTYEDFFSVEAGSRSPGERLSDERPGVRVPNGGRLPVIRGLCYSPAATAPGPLRTRVSVVEMPKQARRGQP